MDMAEEEHPEPAVTIEDLPTDTHDSLPGAADDEAGPAEPADQEQMQAESAEPTGATLPEPAVASECVKVAVRVRPLSAKEMAEGSSQCVSFPASGQIVIVSGGAIESEHVASVGIAVGSLTVWMHPPHREKTARLRSTQCSIPRSSRRPCMVRAHVVVLTLGMCVDRFVTSMRAVT